MALPALAGKDLVASAKCHTLRNGVKMPIMGLGTWRLRADRLRAGLCGALHERYGLIDSAAVYGNEEEIRELLKEAGELIQALYYSCNGKNKRISELLSGRM